ncbi:MAG: hypothetical protein ABI867_06765 [Kofleriaceae bacterium]
MQELLRRLFRQLGRWPIALATCGVLAGLVLLPGLGDPGLLDPQERQLADRVAPHLDAPAKPLPTTAPTPANENCLRTVPKDAVARSLTARAIELGRDELADSDAGRRLPLALLGLLAVLATAGTAMRAGGARAGVVTCAVLLAMPLLVLQSRSLTSEIGTACGAALIVYGLVALSTLRRRAPAWLALDAGLAAVALVAGLAIAFVGGGALLGLVVPIGAVAAAGSLGVPLVVDAIKRKPFLHHIPAALATAMAIGLVAVLAYQLYKLVDPFPGMTPPPARQVLGKAIIPEGCYSDLLGAIWRPEDDQRFIFDSTFEQIAYGTFPWGLLAPIAMFALLRSLDPRKRMIGAVTLAWAGGAWIATEAFQRKVGFTIYGGFPAIAIAVGVWLDDLLVQRARRDPDGMPGGAMLLGLFVALGVLDLAKDLQSFSEKLTSLLVGLDTIPYPKEAVVGELPFPIWVPLAVGGACAIALVVTMVWQPARWRALAAALTASVVLGIGVAMFGLAPRLWVLVLGMVVALGFQLSLSLWRTGEDWLSRLLRRIANVSIVVALAVTIVLAAFWSFVWQPRLALHLSSKSLFDMYNDLRADTPEPLVIMGDLGQAPLSYTDVKPETVTSREQVVTAMKRPQRVFAIAPQAELCALHREMGEQRYYVLEDRNTRSLLLSNRVDGTTDKNPLSDMIAHKEPPGIKFRPKGKVVWDNKIELIGWSLPQQIDRGDSFEIVTYFRIQAPPGGAWTMLMHFDGPLRLRDGDHKPIKDRCPTSSWMPGDYIIDRHTMKTGGGGFPAGKYDLWIGFFTGSAPNFRNMTVSAAPSDMRDTVDRVKITSINLD